MFIIIISENLELLERGELKKDYSGNGSDEDEEEESYSVESSATIISHAQVSFIEIYVNICSFQDD
jgi:hypothetical protein